MAKSFKFLVIAVALWSISIASVPGGAISNAPLPANTVSRWRNGAVKIAVSGSLLKQNPNMKSDSDAAGAIARSLATWAKAANVSFQDTVSDKQNVSPSGNQGDGISLITIAATPENLLLFSKNPQETAATTRVFFDRKGFIIEADIVLNPYQQFSTDGTFGTFDLESTLTHEIGHLLGLDHSSVLSATMHDNYGKNGVLGLQNFVPRTLAAIDISAIRSKYGSSYDEIDTCCGSISGKIIGTNGRAAKGVHIWAESAETGKLSAETTTETDGGFRFVGLGGGDYNIYAQRITGLNTRIPAQEIGKATVEAGETVIAPKRLKASATDFQLHYLGFNGQLSGLAIPLSAGRTYTVYLGGKNFDKDSITISFNSPFLTVSPKTIANVDFGGDISVVSFEVRVDPLTPVGEYSVIAESQGSGPAVMIGGIAVRNSANPYGNLTLASE
ncbi:MAG: matrixin family metalloprotease [Pyrinomonadaceae bacterium]